MRGPGFSWAWLVQPRQSPVPLPRPRPAVLECAHGRITGRNGMPPVPTPRKRRTREHVLADLSINHVERFILEEGHTAYRPTPDYGYDLFLSTFDEQGYSEPGVVCIQVKAAESLQAVGDEYVFDLDVRDYNLW